MQISKTSKTHQVEIIKNYKRLIELQFEWNELAHHNKVEPWQSFSWIKSAATAYSKKHYLRIVIIKKDGKLTAIAPLILKPNEQAFHPWQLQFLGGEELKEPNRLIAKDAESLYLLIDAITSERVFPMRLSRIINDHAIGDILVSKFKKKGWITKVMQMPYPYIDLTKNSIKKSLLRDLRRARKKADKLGDVSFQTINELESENLRKHLNKAFRIEASGWKGQNRTAILTTEWRKTFFERYAKSAFKQGCLNLSFLKINNEAVAVQYAVESMNSYWLLNIGYDERYRNCSPGNLLLEESIKTASKKGLTRFNFLGKEAAWTKRWTTSLTDTTILAAYRPNLYGAIAMLSDALYLMRNRKKGLNF
ncbi:MAG: GNAT family N-acetyltransferase [Desulfobacteraceae bacterium]|nr:GNAT family N-acetyltransferase [Desulfobacteraceae bacterium]